MVAVATPIWAVAEGQTDALGDVASLARFMEWCTAVGFDEVVLLPLHPHIMDSRLHALRHMLMDLTNGTELLGRWKVAVDELFDEFVEISHPPHDKGVFLFERCPYYSASAFALSPMWCSVKPVSESAEAIRDYFDGLHVQNLVVEDSKAIPAERPVNFTWVSTWVHKTLALADNFFAENIEQRFTELLVQKLASGAVADDDFLNWCDCNESWAYAYATWEALVDQDSYRKLQNEVRNFVKGKKVWPIYTPSWQNWSTEEWSKDLLIKLLGQGGHVARNIVFSLWSQYRIQQDWREKLGGRRVEIVGDIPIYVPTDSADVWANPHIFGIDPITKRPQIVSGLPPDYWSSEGQLWGTPTYNWQIEYNENVSPNKRSVSKTFNRECYIFWRNRIQRQLLLFDRIRMDHYRAFADYWGVPSGPPGSKLSSLSGTWLEGPGSALYFGILRDLNICSTRFVVEDLGEETALFAKLRSELPFVNMAVLQFVLEAVIVEKKTKATDLFTTGEALSNTLLFTSTHDNPPLQAWIESLPADKKEALSVLTAIPLKVLNSCVAGIFMLNWLMETGAWTRRKNGRQCFAHTADTCLPAMSALCIQIQDLLALSHRINVPGQISGGDLWSWRLSPVDWSTMSSQPYMDWLSMKLKCPG